MTTNMPMNTGTTITISIMATENHQQIPTEIER